MSASPRRPSRRLAILRVAWAVACLAAAALSAGVPGALAQDAAAPAAESAADVAALDVVGTESPRETFVGFLRLSAAMEAAVQAYIDAPSFAGAARLALLSDQMNALLDLEGTAATARREVGIRTMTFLMDIFGRIEPIDPAALPGRGELQGEGVASVRLPGTPLFITRLSEGPRAGEYVFDAATIDAAPRFFRSVRATPLRSALGIESFSTLGPQLTGPAFPPGVVRAVPEALKRLWLDTPIWKVVAALALTLGLTAALGAAQRGLGAVAPAGRIARLAVGALLPLLLLGAVGAVLPYAAFQLNLSGRFADGFAAGLALVAHVAWAWLYWIAVRMGVEWIILSPRIADKSLDANLLRLVSGVLGLVGAAVILAYGGQAIGLPVLSILAGLGIGGLAVALALRPTMENLVGGVMLYIDRPVRVGDFCSFGDQKGVVENIGVRSTTLRALDRTLISVPNAQFADMQIVNFAHCDQMLIHETLGLRYETSPDQLRYVLAQLRRMLHAHPRIDAETIRVRFAGYGEHALKVDLRVYAMTREWNDFFAIREDVLLRLHDVVSEAGAGFAFPSQTLYLARDGQGDAGRRAAAEARVQAWRETDALPFPRLARDEIERLEATLDWPPRGSTERRGGGGGGSEQAAEPLSAGEEDGERQAGPPPRAEPV